MIRRVFVEKKAGYDTVRQKKQAEIESALGVKFAGMRMLIRYDIDGRRLSTYLDAEEGVIIVRDGK